MITALGAVVALGLLCVIALALWWSWRQPFIGLGLLVAGMAVHSFVLMVLLRLETPSILVRLVQAWKELLLVVLIMYLMLQLWSVRQTARIPRMPPTDWVVAAFAVLAVIYFLVPSSVMHSGANLAQRLVGFRILVLIPVLYVLGRTLIPRVGRALPTALWLCLGSATLIALFGIFEVFFIPTTTWLGWGEVSYANFLGFTYHGPGGLPENFFVSLPDGSFVRRMVSTYVSPLGVAYTGLLLFPMAVAIIDRTRSRRAAHWAVLVCALVVVAVAMSLTRLALFALIGEAAVLFLILRRPWVAALVPALVVVTVIVLYPYTSIAPAVDRNLQPIHRTGLVWAISGHDSSAQEHYAYLVADLKFDLQHPLGLGTGASTVRYGRLVGTGESAVLGIFGDLGMLGGTLYVALYLLVLWHAFMRLRHARTGGLDDVIPIVCLVGGLALIPITMTSDLWGDLSVTFLFWWTAGASTTLAQRRILAVARLVMATEPAHAL